MIDDIKDISRAEKEKAIARHKRARYFWQCIATAIVFAVAMTLFSLFMIGNFKAAFTVKNALATTGRMIIAVGMMIFLMAGVYRFTSAKGTSTRDFHLTAIMVLVTFFISITAAVKFNEYAMPIALATLVLIELIDRRTSTLATAVLSILIVAAFMIDTVRFDLAVIMASVICNALCAVLVDFYEKKHLTRLKFLLVSMATPLLMQPFVLLFTLLSKDVGMNLLWHVVWSYGANVAASLIFMPLVAIFEGVFNIADDFRLNELCNLSNPLLKRLASEAPGTFNHSLVVGNLAEACATAIGENPNMARCAAYYHDIGKLKAPIYFSENQSSYNPHDELIPEVSVSMITSHTLFGEILAKQNRLPKEIVAICREHHGTSPVGYFYRKALTLKEEGDLAVDKYTYAGPKPQTKIAAIIMIADTIEAAMRAYMPDTKEEFEARINKLVDEKIELRQFDECPITMGDIATIKRTIIEVLPSIHHSRVSYDKKKKENTFAKN